MTIYQYECEKCGVFDRMFGFGKAPKKTKCECGKSADRHYGSLNFALKGNGWPGKEHKAKNNEADINDVDSYTYNPKRDGSAFGK